MPEKLKYILRHIGFLLVVYFLLRVLFFAFNYNLFASESLGQILYGFVHGIRFDLYSIFWVNSPIIVYWLFAPNRWQESQLSKHFVTGLFFLINSFFIGWNVTDWEFFNFAGKRTTMDIFFLAEDITAVGWDIVSFYWLHTLLGLGIFLSLIVFRWKISKPTEPFTEKGHLFDAVATYTLFVFCMVLAMRGGWQLKPIRPVNAYAGVSNKVGALTLNTTFTLLRSKKSGAVEKRKYFDSREDLVRLMQRPSPLASFGTLKGHNVLLIILESFSMEYTGLGAPNRVSYTPFLDELANDKRSRISYRHFANGRRSIDAVPSLLVGIPSLMEDSFVSSNYQTNNLVGWGELLKRASYSTHFFHGAKNGSMFFDSFSAQVGFENYYGLNEYPTSENDNDGSWGIFDEPFFLFTGEVLSKAKKPFGAVLFSLSSHHPYRIPKKMEGQFPKGTLDIHQSIGYADFSLKTFFEYARNQAWYNTTLFIITADHTSKAEHPKFQTLQGGYHVPLVLFHPTVELPKLSKKAVTQHLDIPKTVMNLLGIEVNKDLLFGSSVFSPQRPNEVINYAYPGFWYLNQDGFFKIDAGGNVETAQRVDIFHEKNGPPDVDSVQKAQARIHAWIQYYFNGLLENNWYVESTPATQ